MSRSLRRLQNIAVQTGVILAGVVCLTVPAPTPIAAQTSESFRPVAEQRLRKIVHFYRSEVGYQGAYLWRYAADLTHQEGEEIATATSGWTQPPGTPSVGVAYLNAYYFSGEPDLLDAATEVAHALVRAQLKSGGWSSHFDLEPPGRNRYAYRTEDKHSGKYNYTTFDDDKTQAVLRCLMLVDEVLGFEDATIHEAVEFALQRILAIQYPNGGWPQQYDQPVSSPEPASRRADYPSSWSRQHRKTSYRHLDTLNDNNMSKIVDTLIEA